MLQPQGLWQAECMHVFKSLFKGKLEVNQSSKVIEDKPLQSTAVGLLCLCLESNQTGRKDVLFRITTKICLISLRSHWKGGFVKWRSLCSFWFLTSFPKLLLIAAQTNTSRSLALWGEFSLLVCWIFSTLTSRRSSSGNGGRETSPPFPEELFLRRWRLLIAGISLPKLPCHLQLNTHQQPVPSATRVGGG